MAGQAVDRLQHLIHICRVDDVADRVPLDRMTVAVLNRQQDHFAEVVFRQLHFAVENRDQMLAFQFLRGWRRAVALQAKRVRLAARSK